MDSKLKDDLLDDLHDSKLIMVCNLPMKMTVKSIIVIEDIDCSASLTRLICCPLRPLLLLQHLVSQLLNDFGTAQLCSRVVVVPWRRKDLPSSC
ncbi:hypothetical protein HPP92_016834 [Vanilla planifolia]|uniref:Uncharacterized protein n=1 Tax=Vanilla planifolia TaxID=51239 RepID=A0A835QIV1_VANPL|nr:hypothetical protein HPP92_016834 [Vanilla planifolia]